MAIFFGFLLVAVGIIAVVFALGCTDSDYDRQHRAREDALTRAITIERYKAAADRTMAQSVADTLDRMSRIREGKR